jgi:hypothetical protein
MMKPPTLEWVRRKTTLALVFLAFCACLTGGAYWYSQRNLGTNVASSDELARRDRAWNFEEQRQIRECEVRGTFYNWVLFWDACVHGDEAERLSRDLELVVTRRHIP